MHLNLKHTEHIKHTLNLKRVLRRVASLKIIYTYLPINLQQYIQ